MKDAQRVQRLVGVRERLRDLKRADVAEAERSLARATEAAANAARGAQAAHDALMRLELVDVTELETRAARLTEARHAQQGAEEHTRSARRQLGQRREDLVSAEIDVRTLGLVEARLLREEERRREQREQREQDERVSAVWRIR